jgi:hypothetical protein
MATALRTLDSYPHDRIRITRPRPISDGPPLGFGTARPFEQTCHVVVQLIDISLTVVFLVAGVVQAAFLLFMLAGQTLW